MRPEHWLYTIPLRLRSLFRRNRVERELDEELQYHLEKKIEQFVAEGMSPLEARHAAMRATGGLSQQQEACRDARGTRWLEDLAGDIRYGLRTLRKTPALATVIIVSLALGIGANTAIFSVLNAVLLKMLPVQDPDQLALLTWSAKGFPGAYVSDLEGSGENNGGVFTSYSLPSAIYQQIKTRNQSFSNTLAFAANDDKVNVGLNGKADSATAVAVSGDFFQTLGVSPLLGRTFVEADDNQTAPPTVVVSHHFWISRMAGDPAVVGRTITVDGVPATVIGVAQAEFFGLEPGQRADFWIPLGLYRFFWTRQITGSGDDIDAPRLWWLGVIGRLKPGVSLDQARAELSVLFQQNLTVLDSSRETNNRPQLALQPARRGLDGVRSEYSKSLLILMAMVGLVLLIACANVAGLLLARATARRREIAVRLSMGAARSRIIRQLLTENVLLAVMGGGAGLMFSRWASVVLAQLLASGKSGVFISVSSDGKVLAFTVVASLLSGILFGLAPALRATRVDVYPTLKQSIGASMRAGQNFVSGKVLVGAQVALCLLLLVCAGLLVRTLRRLQVLNLGFDRSNLITFRVHPGLNGYSESRLQSYYEELQRRIASLPAVRSATFSQLGPIASGSSSGTASIPGYTPPDSSISGYDSEKGKFQFARHIAGPEYFHTLGIPLTMGRLLGPQDTKAAQRVVVVNEKLVQEQFHGDNPLGHIIQTGSIQKPETWTVVGVVRNVKYNSVRNEPPATIYFPYQQHPIFSFETFQVRTSADPSVVLGAIQQQALTLDRDVPIVNLRTETEVVDQALFLERTFALLSASFGALALLLACVGLYGTVAYTVAQRTSEIGIRMALGARRELILGMVLRETLLIVLAGIVIGLPLAWIGARLLAAQLFGLSPHDPATIAIACVSLLAVTSAAGFIPAHRASRVDPMVALRYE